MLLRERLDGTASEICVITAIGTSYIVCIRLPRSGDHLRHFEQVRRLYLEHTFPTRDYLRVYALWCQVPRDLISSADEL